jgi:hypothetical protein
MKKSSDCHFEIATGKSINLLLNGFLHSAPVLSAKAETGASVDPSTLLGTGMTAFFFYRAT